MATTQDDYFTGSAGENTFAGEPETLEIGKDATGRARFKVRLVGKEYSVRPPKAALGLKLAVRAKQFEERPDLLGSTINEFIDKAFSEADAAEVKRRMYEDENDDLDFPHVMTLMEKLMERTMGELDRPTT